MSALQPFAFEDHLIRVSEMAGEPWFIARDICRALAINNVSKAVSKLDDDERRITSSYTPGGEQEHLSVSESGMYTLVLRSRSATEPGSVAHRFRKWVTAEVLPEIRRTGRFLGEVGPPALMPGDPSFNEAVRLVAEARRIAGPRAALAIWRKLGLPDDPALDGVEAELEGEDSVARFVAEGVEKAFGITTPSTALWQAFRDFCEFHDLPATSQAAFQKRFARAGFARRKTGGRMVYDSIRPKALEAGE